MRILVVEDEAPIAEYLQRSLEEIGCSSYIAGDADKAGELLQLYEIDAITLDLGIPGKGGLAWLEDLARDKPELASKTLVITGAFLESEGISRLARCGAGILSKPFTIDQLREAVRVQLERPGMNAARAD
jgi:two-component system OmpR family response regulator